MKNILIMEFWNCNPHLETALELAKRHVDSGDSVAFYFCGHDTIYKEGIVASPEDCGLFRKLPEVQGAELINSDRLIFVPRVKMPEIEFEIPAAFESLESLMALKYGTFEVGVAVVSSLVSNTRNSRPNLDDNIDVIRDMVQSAVQVYEFTKMVIEQQAPELVYLFNGRFCNHRAAMRAILDMGKELLLHERGANKFLFDVQPFMSHDVVKWQQNIVAEWERCGHNQNARALGEKFFIDRREGLEQFWLSFTDHQKKNLLPEIDITKKVVTYFSASDDEFVSLGDLCKFSVWKSQLDALNDLIDICTKDKNIQLFVRLHPHLREKSREDQLRWLALGEIEGVTIVSFDSDVDTYALIDQSDIVVTAGSTVGVEAAFWERPSISLGPSYYSELGVTLNPKSMTELKDLIDADELPVDRDRTIPYGYYMMTFGKEFFHYVPETLFKGKFLGADLHGISDNRRKWLRFRQMISKPYRGILKIAQIAKLNKSL